MENSDKQYERYIGKTLDERYSIVNIIGIGGMAAVFGAFDMHTGQTVALKMLRSAKSSESSAEREQARALFVNEAEAMKRLSHKNIVKIIDTAFDKEPEYFTMEYVEGTTLKKYLEKKERLTLREILLFSDQILSALAAIHKAGIIHCDIKPHNILLMKNDTVKITDFGISRLPGVSMISTDRAVGTVYYVSPEQASGRSMDSRSDIYSFGIMLYEMVTGKLPFYDNDPDVAAALHLNSTPRRPKSIVPNIPKGLDQIIMHALEKRPSKRFISANDFRDHISALAKNPDITFNFDSIPRTYGDFTAVRKGSPIPVILGIAAAFVLTAVICFSVIRTAILPVSDGYAVNVEVPSLEGQLYSDACEYIDTRHYSIKLKYSYDPALPEGAVLEQSPVAGSVRKIIIGEKTCNLVLTINRTPLYSVMEDFSMYRAEDVYIHLDKLGYSILAVYEYDDSVPEGYVLGTSPQMNESLSPGQTVTLYISKGTSNEPLKVPELIGKAESTAKKMIDEAGLIRGSVTYVRSSLPIGTVISQSISANTELVPNEAPTLTVDLTVSGGDSYIAPIG